MNMMVIKFLPFVVVCLMCSFISLGQGPWNRPLQMAWSADGKTFSAPSVFQDSSGVPSVIRWKGDTLIAAFQWFRQPKPSPSWDRVAVKISYDNGLTWTQPAPISISGLPVNYQRPFDPTLTTFAGDSVRIYFSSGAGTPIGLDSTVNTYSATSADGINYVFEPGPRVDASLKPVIDPAVVYFINGWHYIAPIGAPQDGAYHYVSPDGINFSPVPDIPSDNLHNWTGNFIVESSSELRFYGSGQSVWYNSSANGGVWSGYISTNINGGDPSVVKIADTSYLMIYVGQPYLAIDDLSYGSETVTLYPNPATDIVTVSIPEQLISRSYTFSDLTGRVLFTGVLNSTVMSFGLNSLPPGIYVFRIGSGPTCYRVIKQ